jgi:hypothetical protein
VRLSTWGVVQVVTNIELERKLSYMSVYRSNPEVEYLYKPRLSLISFLFVRYVYWISAG